MCVDPDGHTAEAAEQHQRDLQRVPTYNDLKNISLYSSHFHDGIFGKPSDALPCELYDSFVPLVRGRLDAFEQLYMSPIRNAESFRSFLDTSRFGGIERMIEFLTSEDAGSAFVEYHETGDPSAIRAQLERLRDLPSDDS